MKKTKPTPQFELRFLFIFSAIFFLSNTFAQKKDPPKPDIIITPEAVLEDVYDQNGTHYRLLDLMINSPTSTNISNPITCSSTSYFNLYFEPGCGMEDTNNSDHNARRAVVCKVFEDLSNFIDSPLILTGNKVNIWVRNINNVYTSPNGILGMASGFYNVAGNTSGIADSEIWKTIHTGVDSYQGVTVPLSSIGGGTTNQAGIFYHGMITFNFNTTNVPAINWNTSLTATTIPTTTFDLYSAVLHEITHALGFNSLIDTNGNSKFGPNFKYYSRYDRYLKTNNLSEFIITNPTACSMYDYGFNPNLNTSVLHPNPSLCLADTTSCNNAIKFAGTTPVPVYTPNCFSNLSSLSHFEDSLYPSCSLPNGNDNYFLMCNEGNSGAMYRYPKPEERQALCDIGYGVKTTFGSASTTNGYFNYGGSFCSGITVAGVNDGITATGNYTFIGVATPVNPIILSGLTILSNDYGAKTFECLQDLTATSANPTTFSAVSGGSTTNISFSSTIPGVHLLRYIPRYSTQRGNITYIYVFVQPPAPITCNPTPTACNLVSNGNFEQNVILPTFFSYPTATDNQFERACGWFRPNVNNSPDYNYTNPTAYGIGVPCNSWGNQADRFPSAPGDGYAGLVLTRFPTNPTLSSSEIIRTTLTTALVPNTTYQLSFDVSLADFYSNNSIRMQAFISSSPTTNITGGVIPMTLPSGLIIPITQVTTGPNIGILCTNPTFSNNTTGWQTITFTFTTDGNIAPGTQFLYIGGLNSVQFQTETPGTGTQCFPPTSSNTTNNAYYYIDNVSLIPTGGATLDVPPTICSTQTLTNLSIYLATTPPGGVFASSGLGVTNNGGIFSFNATLAGIGTHTITYTYTNASGCPVTLSDTIIVSATPTSIIPVEANDDDFGSLPINATTGGSSPTVYTNDIYNEASSTPESLNNVLFTLIGTIPVPGATITTGGQITIPPNTATGLYTFTYQLQTIGNCTESDTATVTIYVSNFAPTPTISNTIRANQAVDLIELQSTGKIVIAGSFTLYNNVTSRKIARLHNDLTLDTSFLSSGPIPTNYAPRDMIILPDDKIVVVGQFDSFNGGSNGAGIAKLNVNGSVDTSFNVGGSGISIVSNNLINSVVRQSDGKFLIGGIITSYNGVSCQNIIRLNSDGTRDTTFTFDATNYVISTILKIVIQPSGKILLSGFFSADLSQTPDDKHVIRINPNGSIDNTFTQGNCGINFASAPCTSCPTGLILRDMLLQPDGKIIVAGAFTVYNSQPTNNIIRLSADGVIDPTFTTSVGTDRVIYSVNLEPGSNKLLIGGEFTTFNGFPVKKMIRLLPNGSRDPLFSIGSGTTHSSTPLPSHPCYFCYNLVYKLKRQPDGKLIVGGKFTSFNGITAGNITRIIGDTGVQARTDDTDNQSEEITSSFSNNIKVYPNPSKTIFNIDLTQEEQEYTTVAIYNLLGEKVYTSNLVSKEVNPINLSELADGYYIARLNGYNNSVSLKLIKN